MEYWVFQPEENITAYEMARLIGKLKKIPKAEPHLLGVSDSVYDSLQNSHDTLRRHFQLYSPNGIYK